MTKKEWGHKHSIYKDYEWDWFMTCNYIEPEMAFFHGFESVDEMYEIRANINAGIIPWDEEATLLPPSETEVETPKTNLELKTVWNALCDEYVSAFCTKHGVSIKYELNNGYVWVANEHGGIACIGDCFVRFDDIRYDVDNDVEGNTFYDWYYASVERATLGVKYMTYKEYCEGKQDPISKEKMVEIIEAKKKLDEAQNIFYEAIKDYKDHSLEV